MNCNHEYNGQGIFITTDPTAICKKCGQEYLCDDTGKPHIMELLGDDYKKYKFGGVRQVIKRKKDRVLFDPIKTAYTIGNTINYNFSLLLGEEVIKTGRTEDYCGGWVWRNKEDAQAFIDADKIIIDGQKRNNKSFSVYELELPNNYDSDVSKEVDENGVHMLLVDAIIWRQM